MKDNKSIRATTGSYTMSGVTFTVSSSGGAFKFDANATLIIALNTPVNTLNGVTTTSYTANTVYTMGQADPPLLIKL